MARFTEDVNIQPINTSVGAQQGLTSLADRLDNFSGQMAQVQAQKVQKQATEQGTSAGQDLQPGQQPEFQEETFFGGAGKKAYNEGLRAAYLSGIARDNRLSLGEMAANNPDDIVAFNSAVEGARKGLMESVEPTARNLALEQFDQVHNQYAVKIQGNTIDRNNKAILAELGTAAETAHRDASTFARAGDMRGAADALVEQNAIIDQMDITDDQKATMKQQAELAVTSEKYMGDAIRLQEGEGHQAVMDWLEANEEPPMGFTPDEWDKVTQDIQTEANRKAQRQKQAAQADIKAFEHQQSVDRGMLYLDPAVPADPAKGGQARKDVNNYYDSVQAQWSTLPVQEQVNANVEFIKNTGIVPVSMISNVGAAMRSGSVEQVALMGDVMSRLQDEAPATLKDFPEEARATALMITDAVRAGTDVEAALEQARSYQSLNDSEREVIRIQSQAESKSLFGDLQAVVDTDVDEGGFDTGIFSRVPDVPLAMQADYKLSFDRFMNMTGGDAEQAKKLAYGSIKSVWGVSETGGEKRFMKYAPETIYNVPGYGSNWIEDQFNEEMEQMGAEGAILTIDKATAREDMPSYPVMVEDSNGLLMPLMDADGDNVTWKPDFRGTDEYQAIATEPQKNIQKAKDLRSARMERRAGQIRRGIEKRTFQGYSKSERAEFMASPEGKQKTARAINNMLATGRIDEAEANEARQAYGVE